MPKRLKKPVPPKRPSDPILAAQEFLTETEALTAEPAKQTPVVEDTMKPPLQQFLAQALKDFETHLKTQRGLGRNQRDRPM